MKQLIFPRFYSTIKMINGTSLSTIIIDNTENSKQCNKNKANKKWN